MTTQKGTSGGDHTFTNAHLRGELACENKERERAIEERERERSVSTVTCNCVSAKPIF